jgi:hypothetical protein
MRAPPFSEEVFHAATADLEKQSDRGAAVIAAAMLENILEHAITARMRPLSNERHKKLFAGTAPLSTFAAKIDIAFAIGLIGEFAHGQLNMIKEVRNRFAHRIAPLSFEHDDIKQFIKSNAMPGYPKDMAIRELYLTMFVAVGSFLLLCSDESISVKMVGDDPPHLARSVQQFFKAEFERFTTEALQQLVSDVQPTPLERSDESGR